MKIKKRLIDRDEDKTEQECDPCAQDIIQEIDKTKEIKNLDERTWISLGNRMFHIEDVQSMYIQANHLIINFDYTEKQIVIHFGYGENATKNAKNVFESLREMYGAYKMNLPEDANLEPNLMETAYGDHVRRHIQEGIVLASKKIKQRYKNKLVKLNNQMEQLKLKIKEDEKKE